ncbi:DUF4352 domain-containing protein [Streptomyces telluris]|uniref:DUF4352 domain-containing protein n=1 Tax=Streptomyces telluris TaxID=2720021 RepID=A0A9X2RJ77_9ACTN|nr:DUF4352 domain-containing protein [Streptomyces telluris]MCQ8768342.1 DUF4352 domain-containing protein [Streptomyces telluris]NJP80866.1 DUF4352 domain-containing protein [Streptomyces telluris]
MRRQLLTAAAVIVLAATATACNGDGTDPAADASASADKSPAPQQSNPAPDQGGAGQGGGQDKDKGQGQGQGQGQGGAQAVGGKLTLKGKKPGEQLDVTLKGFADPAHSDNKYMKPAAGKRWVAAQFELVNTGTAAYSDSPSSGAKVVDGQGQSFTQTMGSVTEGPKFPVTVNIAQGAKSLGWVVFSVPENSKPEKVQFTLNGGFANETGEWTLKK